MTSLLLKGPYSPLEVSKILNVKPQYVFAFVSACLSLGILSQTQRSAEAASPSVPVLPRATKKQNLFSKILHKLRGD